MLTVLAVAACGDSGGPDEPAEPPRAATITIQPVSADFTYLGQTLTFSATVRDQYGSAMSQAVTWSSSDETIVSVTSGGAAEAIGNGSASLEAAAAGLTANAAVRVQQLPAIIKVVSGNNQEQLRNEELPEPVRIRVEDRGAHGVAGLEVTFAPDAQSGSVGTASATTDENGEAETTWTLGGKFGEQVLVISLAGGIQSRATAQATSDTPLADLGVEGVKVSRTDPTNLETVDVSATAYNRGDAASPDSFAVHLVWQDSVLESTMVPGLDVDGSAPLSYTVGPLEPGTGALDFVIDPGGEIDEWDEENNVGGVDLDVARQEIISVGHASMISADSTEVLLFRVDVEAGSKEALNVEVSGGRGDPDLFVNQGQRPDSHYKYRCFSGAQAGDAELCQLLPTRPGSYHVAVHAFSDFGPVELKVSVGGIPVEPFNIDLVFVDPGTDAQKRVFEQAARRWESVITRDVWDFDFSFNPRGPGQCGQGSPALNDVVDDVRMFVRIDSIDGPGKILGRAGPCFTRPVPFSGAPAGLPGLVIAGSMEFDEDDLARLEAQGMLISTITHEMGHVLGFGTLWEHFGLLENPSFGEGRDPSADVHFTGPLAIAAFDRSGGASYRGAVVPLQSGGVLGQADSHWRESVFENELMTPFLSGGVEPFSVITIESMADLGYEVDPTAADNYRISSAGGQSVAADRGIVVDLGDDILRMPIHIMSRKGRLLRTIHPRR